MGVLDFIKWASETGNPVRLNDGRLVKWDVESDAFVDVVAFGTDSVYVGEIGEKNISVRNSITALSSRMTANDVSTCEIEIFDPGFALLKKDVFILDRVFTFNGSFFKTTAVTADFKGIQIVRITGRPIKAQKLKDDRGPANFGSISPTQFAAQKAGEFGMRFYGEASAVGDPIIRKFEDNVDESTWDVLTRLASDLQFSVFEANDMLFFASDADIISSQPQIVVNVPSPDTDTYQVSTAAGQASIEDEFGGRVDLQLAKNAASTSLFPGVGLQIVGMGSKFDGLPLMIENVEFDGRDSGLVRISARSTDEPTEAYCTRDTFSVGDSGFCVARIQKALGVQETTVYGPYTEQKVMEFQEENGITQTGVVGPVTWAAIEAIT